MPTTKRYTITPPTHPPTAELLELGARQGSAWRDDAACAEVGDDLWFPETGESPNPARKVCRLCAVTSECLAFALVERADWGVWGGLSAIHRRRLLSEHRRDQADVSARVA